MAERKRLLIIGTAQQCHISDFLATVDRSSTEVLLLLPERDRGAFAGEKTVFFSGSFHALFPPLLKSILSFRAHEAVIVCGMVCDHDNVIRAVSFYQNFYDLRISTCVRNKLSPADPQLKPNPCKEILKWVSLGALALLIKTVSMLKPLRVAEIYSSRLGHLVLDCELYLAEKELGRHDGYLDLFCFKDGQVANKALGKLFSRRMRICRWDRYLLQAVRFFNLREKHELLMNTRKISFARDYECLTRQTDTHVSFTPDEIERGRSELAALGLDADRPHICLLGRDNAFLQQTMPESDGDMQEPRNMDIVTFKAGAEELLRLGYNVIRIGNIVQEPLKIDHPNFVDYATCGKQNDFMDIYLPATCKFFVGVQSGPMHVANMFRVPCLRVNTARLEVIEYCSPEDLALFKLIRSKSTGRILNISEIISAKISKWPIENFADSDFEVIDNTEEELLEAMREMHLRTNGEWRATAEERELQSRYFSYLKVSDCNSRFETPISAYFLQKHADELFN
ncbi:TIGR04372 family glycosyltransferase [Desulfovibrio sp. JC010]|uniref:TIGR04372 family glycosyltransferase n=1 Tax=Desulfovibrio sp. JC010 TaxID=2593641 RepID=UPI0013CFC51C|nr:TIGR04372 family glycosyltransferase [Desulfovibrio sp. JC010]NDV26670.1 TIGR04372 family glycosyltransferase [Desulfovibrio sp. JC010]